MATASFINDWSGRSELYEARTEFPKWLELPTPNYTDTLNNSVFEAALEELGLQVIEPVFRDGELHVDAPDGYKFVLSGAFSVWPNGSHFDWSYGPPADSYEMWRVQNQVKLDRLESEGASREDAERQILAGDWETPAWVDGHPDLITFSGPSLTFAYEGHSWGSMVKTDDDRNRSSDDEPAHVTVRLAEYKTIWHEQAARFIQLPNSQTDRMLSTHLYGMPGVIPCWEAGYAEGNIHHIKVELVPVDENDGDIYKRPEERLWFPENVRWAIYDQYPDLVDQMGDHASRSDHGMAMVMLGALGGMLGGKDVNMVHEVAGQADLAVIDHPMFANMPLDKLVKLVDEAIDEHNNKQPTLDDTVDERREQAEKDRERLRKELVVITGVSGAIHQAVTAFAESDQWLEDHVQYRNRRY